VLTCRWGVGWGMIDLNTLNPAMVNRSFNVGSKRFTEKPRRPFFAAVVASMPNETVFTPATANTRKPPTW
jgi:hypothetical protein